MRMHLQNGDTPMRFLTEKSKHYRKGKSSIVRSMGISDFQAIADFSKLSKVDAVPIDVTAKKYSDQLDITLGTTNTMKIKR